MRISEAVKLVKECNLPSDAIILTRDDGSLILNMFGSYGVISAGCINRANKDDILYYTKSIIKALSKRNR